MMKTLSIGVFLFVMVFASASFAQTPPGGETAKEKVLYLFAHQDDEFLILAKMAADLKKGRDVHAVWITDGAGTAEPAAREAESRDVMRLIGAPEANLRFLGYPDRYSHRHLDEVYRDVAAIAAEAGFAKITTNAYEGGNIDHDVASLIGTLVAADTPSAPAHFEFPLYNAYKGNYRVGKFIPFEGAETLATPMDDEAAALKEKAMEMYPSQAAIISMLKTFVNKKKLMKDGEPYRLAPAHDYLKRPTEGALGYELNARNPVTFADWEKEAAPFLERMKAEKR